MAVVTNVPCSEKSAEARLAKDGTPAPSGRELWCAEGHCDLPKPILTSSWSGQWSLGFRVPKTLNPQFLIC